MAIAARNIHLCPVCATPRPTVIDAFTCWNSHVPAFWNTLARSEIAEQLSCTPPRVSQMIASVAGKRKQSVHPTPR